MKKLILSVLVATAAGVAFAGGNADAGKKLASQCTACHGADGNSAAALFPKIAGQNENYIVKQLQDIKSGARPVSQMTAIVAKLSDQDFADLAAYYAQQNVQTGVAKADLVKLGESIYRGGIKAKSIPACTGCHGPAGDGNNGAKYPALAGQHAGYIESQLKAFRLASDEPDAQGARKNDGDTRIMRDVAAGLSDLEIRAVSSFLSGLH